MIFGAPGCGKTTYLINLLEKLLDQYDPNKIAFVSFTKKGSYEGRDRAIKIFNFKKEDFPYFRTIHSIAFRELETTIYDMISKKNYKEFSKSMGMSFLGYYTEDLINNDDKYLFNVSLKKNNIKLFNRYKNDLDLPKFNFIEKNYERYKKEVGVIDFDDLLINFINRGYSLPVDVAIIDEAQDLTSLQWNFCQVAFHNCEKIFIAGDDDQAIYEWSGADVYKFLSLTKNNPIKILEKSYRLKKVILNYSKRFSDKIINRVIKNFGYSEGKSNIFFYNSINDIVINNEETYYFLSRNNYFLPVFKDFIMEKGIAFSYKNTPYIKSSIYKAIKKYETLRQNNSIDEIRNSLELRNFLKQDLIRYPVWYEAFNMELKDLSYYRTLFKNKINPEENKINISTIHGVKGGEADNVILLLNITKNVSESLRLNLESELRCLYVAITRTKKNLHIIHSGSRLGYEDQLSFR
jgi:DNA helicase-2/ATP-dependent DNA helicase PcrA